MEHDLWKTGDVDCPTTLQDSNGEAVLALCKRCGQAEVVLAPSCSWWRKLDYGYDGGWNIVLPSGPPFDGTTVLV